ncbi:formate dehydrogenase accessory sulfurtransferase FdhD [Schlesneria paludicola]|uniref:formate dehydrogenase accessory sulfurtransferase FdhD n=1 Tax=Schlesneria paludicola TaxID=360056 RepID=UPI00029B486E|nr:formate dehydrogenase accessory sulfurtransferase FdhD [Schlesneria paludicola]
MRLYSASVTTVPIISVDNVTNSAEEDELSIEEPLEIELLLHGTDGIRPYSIAVTMRTPGNDVELAAGFLFTEGMIQSENDLVDIQSTSSNVVQATLKPSVRIDAAKFNRHSFVSSSCGVCGKRTIAAVFTARRYQVNHGAPRVRTEVIHGLPGTQREAQANFHRTGGLHASALFDESGNLLSLFEDVGRHNALDKLIGSELLEGKLPLIDRLLLVSGRASFELIQKAAMAGIPVVAAVGAPSSLAVSLARETSMTLLGFVRDNRFNVYSDAGRFGEGR